MALHLAPLKQGYGGKQPPPATPQHELQRCEWMGGSGEKEEGRDVVNSVQFPAWKHRALHILDH